MYIIQMFFKSPSGKTGNMFSTIQSLDAAGVIFQPELQVDTTSTIEVPLPANEFSNAFLIIRLVFLTAAAVCTLVRVARHTSSRSASIFSIFNGLPIMFLFLPSGLVEVGIPSNVV